MEETNSTERKYFYEKIPEAVLRLCGVSKFSWETYVIMGLLIAFSVLWVGGLIISVIEGVTFCNSRPMCYFEDFRWHLGFISFGIAFVFIKFISMSFKKSVHEIISLTSKGEEERKEIIQNVINKNWIFAWFLLALIPIDKFTVLSNSFPPLAFNATYFYTNDPSTLFSWWALAMWIASTIFTGTFVYFNYAYIRYWIRRLPKLSLNATYTVKGIKDAISHIWNVSISIAFMWIVAMSYVFLIFSNLKGAKGIDANESVIFFIGTSLALSVLVYTFWSVSTVVRDIRERSTNRYIPSFENERRMFLEGGREADIKLIGSQIITHDYLMDIDSIKEMPSSSSNVLLLLGTILLNVLNFISLFLS